MSTMQAEIYDAFIDAGASEPKARAAAEVIAQKPQSDEVATKTDIVRLEGKIDSKIAELKGELKDLELRLIKWIASIVATATIAIIVTIITAIIKLS